MEGSIFPTMTAVKVDGSLKQLLKYSQALKGSTFLRSPILIGCGREINHVSFMLYNKERKNLRRVNSSP